MNKIDNLRFPIGHYTGPKPFNNSAKQEYITAISELPQNLNKRLVRISPDKLNNSYREGGWNISELINHLADSHMNSFTRFKLALTEENPTIKPYFENKWAEMIDYKGNYHDSLDILKGLHNRWTLLLRNMDESDYSKTFYHPEANKCIDLYYNLGLYAWHSNHHLAHIDLALNQ